MAGGSLADLVVCGLASGEEKAAAPLDHWITSSARSSSVCGIVSPSAFAVLRAYVDGDGVTVPDETNLVKALA